MHTKMFSAWDKIVLQNVMTTLCHYGMSSE